MRGGRGGFGGQRRQVSGNETVTVATSRVGPGGMPISIKPNPFVDAAESSRVEVRCVCGGEVALVLLARPLGSPFAGQTRTVAARSPHRACCCAHQAGMMRWFASSVVGFVCGACGGVGLRVFVGGSCLSTQQLAREGGGGGTASVFPLRFSALQGAPSACEALVRTGWALQRGVSPVQGRATKGGGGKWSCFGGCKVLPPAQVRTPPCPCAVPGARL
jgi:hypothetical protein